MTQRKQFAAALKANVAIEAIKSEKAINQIAPTIRSIPTRSTHGESKLGAAAQSHVRQAQQQPH